MLETYRKCMYVWVYREDRLIKIRIMGRVVYLTGFGICATVGIVFDMRIRGGERV